MRFTVVTNKLKASQLLPVAPLKALGVPIAKSAAGPISVAVPVLPAPLPTLAAGKAAFALAPPAKPVTMLPGLYTVPAVRKAFARTR